MSSQVEERRGSERGMKKDVYSAQQNASAQRLFKQIRGRIIAERKSQYLTFENIDPEAGSLVAASLNEDAVVENLRPRYQLSFHHHAPRPSLLTILLL
jgi:hypothetical protein